MLKWMQIIPINNLLYVARTCITSSVRYAGASQKCRVRLTSRRSLSLLWDVSTSACRCNKITYVMYPKFKSWFAHSWCGLVAVWYINIAQIDCNILFSAWPSSTIYLTEQSFGKMTAKMGMLKFMKRRHIPLLSPVWQMQIIISHVKRCEFHNRKWNTSNTVGNNQITCEWFHTHYCVEIPYTFESVPLPDFIRERNHSQREINLCLILWISRDSSEEKRRGQISHFRGQLSKALCGTCVTLLCLMLCPRKAITFIRSTVRLNMSGAIVMKYRVDYMGH